LVKKIAPSILAADFGHLAKAVSQLEAARADYIHIDVMDGRFVPNITVGMPVVKTLSKLTSLPLDVHLMIEEPQRYLDDFAQAGSAIIVVHAEACRHLHRAVQHIKELGLKAGVALNPGSDLSQVEFVLPELDLLLIMTVNPGLGGQRFIPNCLSKVTAARRLIDAAGVNVELEVDGGINLNTIEMVAQAGADVFVAGTGIFNEKNISDTINSMRKIVGA
jgi:ribulose-phosphate 3-epimerase